MSKHELLGRVEDQDLEFKSAAVLERPEVVGREVVAMLNATGGAVWIGVREQEGTAVELEPVPDPQRAADALRDALVDSLEPAPLPGEVVVEPITVAGTAVLRVRVEPKSERRPYALVRKGGWHFPLRIGSRIRPMSRQEIFPSQAGDDRVAATVDKVLAERNEFQRTAGECFWLRLQPAAEIELDLESPLYEALASDRRKSGNRDGGWHFAHWSGQIQFGHERISWGLDDRLEVQVFADGGLSFLLALELLRHKGDERELWPYTLLEFPISAFRIAREIYKDRLEADDRVVADLALFGLGGWTLRRGSMGSYFSDRGLGTVAFPEPEDDLVWTKPLVFSGREVFEHPDRCGFRLVKRVYHAFGLREHDMPDVYDRQAERLVWPDPLT